MDDSGCGKAILMLVGFVGLLIGSSIWYGYVLAVLWGWFVAGTFHIAYLSIPDAIGISLVVSMFTSKQNSSKDDEKAELAKSIMFAILFPLFALIFGYIVHGYM